ncbi:cholecystokinin receptor type A-like [Hippocampus comes]|uniref:Gastrin/cholecystokinin type B receptor n=1 Tax=Hippocampus comes TaxID=109280 RepID=A0A3Q2XUA4_HIPCM|nr:PREDICTED: cholecystokinin receptor type A-like [Hippocampus comes]
MDAFTVHEMLNSTEMSALLCKWGVSNFSGCGEPSRVSTADMGVKDLNGAVRVFLYCVIFLISVVGNSLIITVLSRNRRMRTVTNLFLLSLAVSDLMVSLVCIPFTLIPNLMRTFVFSDITCKMVMYFMGVSVSVSTYNLVAIALERYSAICRPLTSRTWQTKSHALKVISATWLTSLSLMLPYAYSSTLTPFNRRNNTGGFMCRMTWSNGNLLAYWYVSLLLLLFLLPGAVMLTAYGLISVELYKGIRFELSNRTSARDRPASFGSLRASDGDGCYLHLKKKNGSQGIGNPGAYATVGRVGLRSNTANLLAKKRVVRMLLVIVCLFFVCWTPIFVVNAWKAFDSRLVSRLTGAPISFIHLLSYTSTCVNPIVYCFMNKRFRQGMVTTFSSLQLKARVIDIWTQIIEAKWYEGPEESALHKRQERRKQKRQQKRLEKRQMKDQRRLARRGVPSATPLVAENVQEASQPIPEQVLEQLPGDVLEQVLEQLPQLNTEPSAEQIGETFVELYIDPYPEQNVEQTPEQNAEQNSQGALGGLTKYISFTSIRSLLPPELV